MKCSIYKCKSNDIKYSNIKTDSFLCTKHFDSFEKQVIGYETEEFWISKMNWFNFKDGIFI